MRKKNSYLPTTFDGSMIVLSHLNSAEAILKNYNGSEPFHIYLKKYFSLHKKFGGRDRKQVAHYCYCFFRLGKALSHFSISNRILAGLFLVSSEKHPLLQAVYPEWNELVNLSIEEKFNIIDKETKIDSVFPYRKQLSEGIDHESFCLSFFQQPDLFIRLRPGHQQLFNKLEQAGGRLIENNCVAFSNTTKIDELVMLNKEAVVQDYSSQRVGELLSKVSLQSPNDKVWDCCAASGGKSILAKDILGEIDLAVSDIRESIIVNLRKRFEQAGITGYKSFVDDIAADPMEGKKFDLIICDVPCTGSGTWSRTPEQLYYFDNASIKRYADLQRRIITNAVQSLNKTGYFLYITCSVFKKENEEQVLFIKENLHLKLIQTEVLKGYDKKADTMFVALFTVSPA